MASTIAPETPALLATTPHPHLAALRAARARWEQHNPHADKASRERAYTRLFFEYLLGGTGAAPALLEGESER